MALYLRFSENILADIERGTSIHRTDFAKMDTVEEAVEYFYGDLNEDKRERIISDCETVEEVFQKYFDSENEFKYIESQKAMCEILDGLCAFELDADNLKDAIEAANELRRDGYDVRLDPNWHILDAKYCGDCPEGDLICNVTLLYSNK